MQVKYVNSYDKSILAINHLAQDKSLIEVKKIKKEGLVWKSYKEQSPSPHSLNLHLIAVLCIEKLFAVYDLDHGNRKHRTRP